MKKRNSISIGNINGILHMVFVFEINDKTGRKIHLTKEIWAHITSSSSPHAYMTNYLENIKEVLIKPDKITDSFYDDKANYYKYYKEKNKHLRAVVRYLNGTGFVITAYFVRNIST